MKKSWLFVFVFLVVVLTNFAYADTNSTNSSSSVIASNTNVNSSNLDKAYNCLRTQISDRDSLSLQEAVFSALALGSLTKTNDVITNQKSTSNNCWPKSSCTIKETAQVAIAYKRMGRDTSDVGKWLTSKNGTTSDLKWYLQIDAQNHNTSTCKVKYDSSERTFTIGSDMKLSGSGGDCLSISSSGYWLEIKDSCLNKEFEVSCNQDFVTSLLYKKASSTTVYVSEETHSAASLGKTTEKVNAQCFKLSGSCDYEGTLWAALAFKKLGKETDAFVPYLSALAEDNEKYLPESFLYILNNGQDWYSGVVQSQKQNRYWELSGSPYNRFYDTSVAMLALAGGSAGEFGSAQDYLLSIQTKEGCWNNNNIRDTAFILYSGWPNEVSSASDSGSRSCESAGNFCEDRIACLDAGGNILSNFECTTFSDSCCSVNVVEATCSQKNGIICASNQECTGRIETSADGSCCIAGACQNTVVENLCESSGGLCKSSCSSGETENTNSCSSASDKCCVAQATKSSSSMWIWILIIGILIILVIIAFLFRDRLRVWWFRTSGKASTTSVKRPPTSPGAPMRYRPMMPMGLAPRPVGMPVRRPVQDSEMEETLRKLKEMSK